MKLKKSTIVLIVLAVIFLGLSVVSTKYSVTRTITAIDEIGDMKLNDDSIDRFKNAAEYYQALDPNQNLEEKITNLKTYKEARLNYARLMIKQASLADKKQDGAAEAVKEAREAVDTYVPADDKWRDEAGVKEIDEETDFIIKVCEAIGMKMLITVPSFDVKDKSVSEIKEEAVERLRYLSDKVGKDIKISLEFCGAPNCSINQFGTAYDVVKAVDRDNVGITVDTFHFHEMCSKLEDLKAADGNKIFAYHLNDCEDLPLGSCGDDKRLWPGEGVVDHAGIAGALKEIGFDGVCTIEEFRPEYYAMSHDENVKKAAEVTRDFVEKYFA